MKLDQINIGISKLPVRILQEFAIEEISVRVPGVDEAILIRLKQTDPVVFQKIFIKLDYDHGLPEQPKLIIDAGANVGYATAWFRAKFPHAVIISIEPDPLNFAVLSANCGRMSNVHLLNAALWSHDAELTLSHTHRSWGVRTNDSGDGTKVPAYALDTVLSKFGFENIDILKLDIEGAEKEVFEAGGAWLEHVRCIAVETHERFKPGSHQAVIKATKGMFSASRRGENHFFYRLLEGERLDARPSPALELAKQNTKQTKGERPREERQSKWAKLAARLSTTGRVKSIFHTKRPEE